MVQFENAVKRYSKLILTELREAKITCWIAGGSLRDYFMGVPIKTDMDLFFPTELDFDACKKHMIDKGGKIEWESKFSLKIKYAERLYDLVKMFFPDPQSTIDDFDFTVSMIAVDNEKVYCHETTFIDLAKRQLILNKLQYPANTMRRAFRYYKKGFTMCVGEMEKLVLAIQSMPKPQESESEDDSIMDAPLSGEKRSRMFNGID